MRVSHGWLSCRLVEPTFFIVNSTRPDVDRFEVTLDRLALRCILGARVALQTASVVRCGAVLMLMLVVQLRLAVVHIRAEVVVAGSHNVCVRQVLGHGQAVAAEQRDKQQLVLQEKEAAGHVHVVANSCLCEKCELDT